MEQGDPIENSFLSESVLFNTVKELKQLKLSAKDYVNIANALLDIAINGHKTEPIAEEKYFENTEIDLPINLGEISLKPFNLKKHKKLLEEWTSNDFGKEFLLSRIDNIEKTPDDLIKDESNIFGIIETNDKVPIGVMGFLHCDRQNNKAELRKLIGNRDYTGKGYGKKATQAWISYGLNKLKLRKIYIYTYDTNLRNVRINRELGFNLEGIFKSENFYKGEPKDILRMALISGR